MYSYTMAIWHVTQINNMSSPEDANYNCKECESKFQSIKELDEHMRKLHKPDLE